MMRWRSTAQITAHGFRWKRQARRRNFKPSSVTTHPTADLAGSRKAEPAVSHSTGGAADRPSTFQPNLKS